VIERREAPREIPRCAVGRRAGCDQPDPLGHRAERRHQLDRIEQGLWHVLGSVLRDRDVVRGEHRVEPPPLGDPRELHVVGKPEHGARLGVDQPPRRLVVAARRDERREMELSIPHRRCLAQP